MSGIVLYNAQQAHVALASLWQQLKPMLLQGRQYRLECKEAKRTLPQNALIHPTIKQIAEAAGRPVDVESLRVLRYLMLEQWRADTNRPAMFERSLDGMRFVDVRKGTSDLDKPDCSEFIEWLYAWGAQHGVRFTMEMP